MSIKNFFKKLLGIETRPSFYSRPYPRKEDPSKFNVSMLGMLIDSMENAGYPATKVIWNPDELLVLPILTGAGKSRHFVTVGGDVECHFLSRTLGVPSEVHANQKYTVLFHEKGREIDVAYVIKVSDEKQFPELHAAGMIAEQAKKWRDEDKKAAAEKAAARAAGGMGLAGSGLGNMRGASPAAQPRPYSGPPVVAVRSNQPAPAPTPRDRAAERQQYLDDAKRRRDELNAQSIHHDTYYPHMSAPVIMDSESSAPASSHHVAPSSTGGSSHSSNHCCGGGCHSSSSSSYDSGNGGSSGNGGGGNGGGGGD